jgi:phenylalanyl-tRNA synthetase beta chain
MNIPLKWLAEYVPLLLSPAELAQRLTIAGLEVAAFRSFGLPVPDGLRVRQEEPGPVWDRDKVFTARLVSVEKHPNADKLKLPLVQYGEGRTQQLVTGAPNINLGDSGQKVVIGLAGTVFFDGHVSPKVLTKLTPKPVRGVPSEGMVMSNLELGINEEHEGIIILDDDAPVGVPYADYMGDLVLEVDILPNMARCLSMLGVAYEVAAMTGAVVTEPTREIKLPGEPITGKAHVKIADAGLCPRYAAGLITNVTIKPAPVWMQTRLTYAGMRPINNIVDVTNYVMLELGQPLHAFDYDVLVRRAGGKAPTITIRPAMAGETLVTLDKVERKLTPDMLLITDEVGPIALAGVMGGLETEVSANTKNILLESASFDPISIRRTSRGLNLISEASGRFSRGVPAESVPISLARASFLMAQCANGTVAAGSVDVWPEPKSPRVIELKMSEVKRILGMEVPIEECTRILGTLRFGVTKLNGTLQVTLPPDRMDIQEGAADLIEDIARLYGYEKLPSTLLREEMPAMAGDPQVAFEEVVRDTLVTLGLQEAITYALTTPEKEAPLGLAAREYVRLLNPISSERAVMRQSLLTGLLEVTAKNLHERSEVSLFEIGSIYLGDVAKKLPEEPRKLAIVLSGRRYADHWGDAGSTPKTLRDFYDLKGVVEELLAGLHVEATFRVATVSMLHPGKAAEIRVNDIIVGVFGELHPRVAPVFELAGKTILVAEIDLGLLRASVPARFGYSPISPFPPALRDVAVIVPEEMTGETIEREIRAAGGNLLREIRLFDVYRGESIPAGTKSLAYALSYQALDKTLADKDIEKAHKGVENRLRHVLKAKIRGQDA